METRSAQDSSESRQDESPQDSVRAVRRARSDLPSFAFPANMRGRRIVSNWQRDGYPLVTMTTIARNYRCRGHSITGVLPQLTNSFCIGWNTPGKPHLKRSVVTVEL